MREGVGKKLHRSLGIPKFFGGRRRMFTFIKNRERYRICLDRKGEEIPLKKTKGGRYRIKKLGERSNRTVQ